MQGKIAFLLFICLLTLGCSAEIDTSPRSIDPTIDICPVCPMSIIDEHFAAQVIDDQGQVHSFDDIGCLSIYMRRLLETGGESSVLAHYVKDFATLEWVKAEEASFVQGQIDTPMSFGIVAFASEAEAQEFVKEVEGKPISWEQVLKEKLTIGLDIEFDYEEFDMENLSQGEVVDREGE